MSSGETKHVLKDMLPDLERFKVQPCWLEQPLPLGCPVLEQGRCDCGDKENV